MDTERELVLELEDVTASADDRYDHGLTKVSLALARGDAAVVTTAHHGLSTPLADLCSGLTVPESGAVRFLGRPWSARRHGEDARDRGRIGRVWADAGWIGNLDLDENILLPQRHHTARSSAELREEAETLARALGLDGLPQARPAWASADTLRKAQWVRALMGSPALLLLEYPDEQADPPDRARLAAALERARQQGTAVLWIAARGLPDLTAKAGRLRYAMLRDSDLVWQPTESAMTGTTGEAPHE